ncbi:MAG TPA: hypothetical protein VGQ37_09420 [Vicinamibacterales bacterium]|jgi:hypothetical protein|nr:hypothetical protein [Vicinamibacterales bacterium]
MKRWIVLAGVSVSLVAAATASAQERLAVRAVAAITKTGSGFRQTALVGGGVGVDVGEFFEVLAEGAIAPAVDYPPPTIIPAGPVGPPFSLVISLIEEEPGRSISAGRCAPADANRDRQAVR